MNNINDILISQLEDKYSNTNFSFKSVNDSDVDEGISYPTTLNLQKRFEECRLDILKLIEMLKTKKTEVIQLLVEDHYIQ